MVVRYEHNRAPVVGLQPLHKPGAQWEKHMGCNHKKRFVIDEGTFPRYDKTGTVKEDTVSIMHCPACGAIRIDQRNVFCCSEGRWSLPRNRRSRS